MSRSGAPTEVGNRLKYFLLSLEDRDLEDQAIRGVRAVVDQTRKGETLKQLCKELLTGESGVSQVVCENRRPVCSACYPWLCRRYGLGWGLIQTTGFWGEDPGEDSEPGLEVWCGKEGKKVGLGCEKERWFGYFRGAKDVGFGFRFYVGFFGLLFM